MTNQLFSQIYCISLAHRNDRREKVRIEFAKAGIENVLFWKAVDGSRIKARSPLNGGQTGCLLSHLEILKDAARNRYGSILIFEDDVEFSTDYKERIVHMPKSGWDMFYLGGSDKFAQNQPINDHISRLKGVLCTHAYAVKNHAYLPLITALEETIKPIDTEYADLQYKMTVLGFRPKIAWQREGYSDVIHKRVRYLSATNEPNPNNEW